MLLLNLNDQIITLFRNIIMNINSLKFFCCDCKDIKSLYTEFSTSPLFVRAVSSETRILFYPSNAKLLLSKGGFILSRGAFVLERPHYGLPYCTSCEE